MSAASARRAGIDLAVPAYVHPLESPATWEALVEHADTLRFVVVNVHNGPGESLDPSYPPVLARLRAAGVRLLGYVDSDYGRRPAADVVADARTWVTRYGVRGVFLDQVSGSFAELQHYGACAVEVRAAGAPFVVLNHGADCDSAYADVANVLVTFEGTWQNYAGYRPPAWMLSRPSRRFCHLVYDVPAAELAQAPDAAAARHAGTAFFTSGTGGNPWDRFPVEVPRSLADRPRQPVHLGGAPITPPHAASPRGSWPGRRYAVAPARPAARLWAADPPATDGRRGSSRRPRLSAALSRHLPKKKEQH